VRDRATLYLNLLGNGPENVSESAQSLIFERLDVPLANLEASLQSYVSALSQPPNVDGPAPLGLSSFKFTHTHTHTYFLFAEFESIGRNQARGHLMWQQFQQKSSHNPSQRKRLPRAKRLARIPIKKWQPTVVDFQAIRPVTPMRNSLIQFLSLLALENFSRCSITMKINTCLPCK